MRKTEGERETQQLAWRKRSSGLSRLANDVELHISLNQVLRSSFFDGARGTNRKENFSLVRSASCNDGPRDLEEDKVEYEEADALYPLSQLSFRFFRDGSGSV